MASDDLENYKVPFTIQKISYEEYKKQNERQTILSSINLSDASDEELEDLKFLVTNTFTQSLFSSKRSKMKRATSVDKSRVRHIPIKCTPARH